MDAVMKYLRGRKAALKFRVAYGPEGRATSVEQDKEALVAIELALRLLTLSNEYGAEDVIHSLETGKEMPIGALLLAKFPAFDPNWEDGKKLKWFDGFARLVELLSANAYRESQGPKES